MPKRAGRPSVAQTPAPKSDKIYGSKKNPSGSATEKKSKSIKLSDKTIDTLKEKLDNFKKSHPNKKSVDLNDLKAVYRRGSGAYSKSHRPTITGGAPNSRAAWSYARVNKFLKKAGGAKVKAAYVQDDDLMANGGVVELLGKIQVHPNGGADVSLFVDENNVGYVEIKNDKVENLLYAPSKLEGISKKDYVSDPQYKILTDDLKKYGIKPSDKIHYIEQIEIYEDYRGKGYASQALSDAIDFYKDEGVEFLLLTVGADTSEKGALSNKKLIDFYSRHGFKLLKGSGNYKNRMILDLKEFAKGGKVYNDKELLAKYKKGESIGFTGEAHLKAKGLIPRADGTKRKSEKYMAKGGKLDETQIFILEHPEGMATHFAKGAKIPKGGDCYEAAGQFCMGSMYMPEPVEFIGEPYLVHAEVKGQGKAEGIRFGHAWVEDDENVYDYSNGRRIVMPKVVYYAIGDIQTENPQKYQKYTFPEARAKMLKTKHYGSWDIETEYADGGVLDSLTPEQYNLVRTPEFKDWFGDWEKEKLNTYNKFDELTNFEVTDDGKPRIWYHGRNDEYNTFDKDTAYFAETAKYAKQYGEIVKPFFVKCKNTLNLEYIKKNKAYKFEGLEAMVIEAGGEWEGKDYEILKNYYSKLEGDDAYFLLWEYFTQYNRLHKHFENWLSKYFDSIYYWETGKEYGRGFHSGKILYIFGDVSQRVKLADGTNTTFDENNPDIRYADGGNISWDDYVKTQFNEDENRHLPSDYFEPFSIKEVNIEDYPNLLKEANGLEYRQWKYGGIGVFDRSKQVAFADNGAIQVADNYQKRGIGLELVTLLKEINPNHKFGNMTPQGWNLMRSYYDKKIKSQSASQHITCINCGWEWETADSAESDKYVCHQCGFDNSLFYDGGLLKPTMPLDQIAEKHGVSLEYLEDELNKGMQHEKEHTNSDEVATTIALHHLAERPDYYEELEKMKLEDGGEVIISDEDYEFWIGGDENYGKAIKQDGVIVGGIAYDEDDQQINGIVIKNKFRKKGIAKKAIKALFDKNPDLKRVYVRAVPESKGFWKKIGTDFDNYNEDAGLWEGYVKRFEDGGEIDLFEDIDSLPENVQAVLAKYSGADESYTNAEAMLAELEPLGYTFEYGLDALPFNLREIDVLENNSVEEYEIEDFLKKQKEEAQMVMTCDSSKIYKAMICKTKCEIADKRMSETENPEELNAWLHYKNIWSDCMQDILDNNIEMYKAGGKTCGCGCGSIYSKGGLAFANGGLAYGNSHDKGGMPLTVKSTGQNIEIEGGEGVVNKRSMQSSKKIDFQGQKMTPCEAVSKINEMGGGVKFKCADVKNIIEEDGHF